MPRETTLDPRPSKIWRIIKCAMATIGVLFATVGGHDAARADAILSPNPSTPAAVSAAYDTLVAGGHNVRVIQYDMVSTSWIILYDNNGYVQSGMPAALVSALNTVQSEGYPITNISFTPTGGWVFFYGTISGWWNNIPPAAGNEMILRSNQGYHLKSIAFGANGSWVLFFGQNGCWEVGADSALLNAILAAQNTSGSILTSISSAPNGGWVFFYRVPAYTVGAYTAYSNYTYYENIPSNLSVLLYGLSNSSNGASSDPYIGDVPIFTLDFVPGLPDTGYSMFYNIGTLP